MKNKVLYLILGIIAVIVVVVLLLANRTCLVTFDTGGGTLYATERIKCGTKVKQPKNPVMDGYVFVEWVNLKDNKKFNFNGSIDEDTTIKAVYEKAK